MKASPQDLKNALLFPEKEDTHGFGSTQARAGLSTNDIQRLLDLQLIKMTWRGTGICGRDCKWDRQHTHFVRG